MLSIGPKKEARTLVEIMLECHGRIREQLALARRLAAAVDAPADEVKSAAERVFRYFSESLPLHVQDEDLSFAPRMRGRSATLDEALDDMHTQHVAHDKLVARLLALCVELRAEPERHAMLAPSLSDAAAHLTEELSNHLDLEERVIFPAVDTQLDAQAQRAIVREIRHRRE